MYPLAAGVRPCDMTNTTNVGCKDVSHNRRALGVDHAALDDGQQVPLHPLADSICTCNILNTKNIYWRCSMDSQMEVLGVDYSALNNGEKVQQRSLTACICPWNIKARQTMIVGNSKSRFMGLHCILKVLVLPSDFLTQLEIMNIPYAP